MPAFFDIMFENKQNFFSPLLSFLQKFNKSGDPNRIRVNFPIILSGMLERRDERRSKGFR
jgi:hypothetical protein